jgi:hypothetical protein
VGLTVGLVSGAWGVRGLKFCFAGHTALVLDEVSQEPDEELASITDSGVTDASAGIRFRYGSAVLVLGSLATIGVVQFVGKRHEQRSESRDTPSIDTLFGDGLSLMRALDHPAAALQPA